MSQTAKNGIVIVATGHSYYGRMAYNLALSVKANDPGIEIAIIYNTDGISHLSDEQLNLFDYVIHGPEIAIGTSAKLSVYENSPFEKTLLLDADMIWLPERKPSEIFNALDGYDFTCICEGTADKPNTKYYFWAEWPEISKAYKLENMYQFRSEVLYFRKSPKIKKLFSDALKIYNKPGLKTIRQHAGTVPDELALNIAAAKNDIHPHMIGWQPSYWFQMNQMQMPNPNQLNKIFFLASMGGNVAPNNVKKFYNTLMQGYRTQLGYGYPFQIESKRDLMKSRQVN